MKDFKKKKEISARPTVKFGCRSFSTWNFYSAISTSTPVQFVQENLMKLHEQAHLPWWAVIGISTLTIRTCLIPLSIHQQQVMSRLARLRAELASLAPELNKEVNIAKGLQNWDTFTSKEVYKIQMRLLYQERVVRDNCHPAKLVILGLIQVPVWVCFSVALRNLCFWAQGHTFTPDVVLSLKTEGALWFTDLTIPDPIILPLVLFLVNIALIEVHALRGKDPSLLEKVLLNTSRGITVLVGVAATLNPCGVTLYWLCSSSFGLLQNLILRHGRVRKLLGLHAIK